MNAALNKKFRILRAIEGEGEAQTTEDFVVKAAFLSFSEVLEPMSDTAEEVLVSDDNVIPMRDSIESIKALVGWLTRDPGFEITAANMTDLAQLSDKYIIEALRKDIRNYTRIWISSRIPPTFELWEFAVRHSFEEMERYCRTVLSEQIDSIITDRSKGVQYLLERGLPVSFVSQLVCDIVTRMQCQRQHVRWLRHCLDEADVMRTGRRLNDDHVDEYQKDVKQGRFSYVEALTAMECRVCSRYYDM